MVSSPEKASVGSKVLPSDRSDRRADGQVRSVSLTREIVRIDRRLLGIAMRVAVPVRDYRGVALSLRPDADGRPSYRLHLLHQDRDLSVTLEEARDDRDILANWRLWSRFFRLPALVERQRGIVEEADPSLAALLVGGVVTVRRTPRALTKRRPRFLGRRKPGVAGDLVVLDKTREMIART